MASVRRRFWAMHAWPTTSSGAHPAEDDLKTKRAVACDLLDMAPAPDTTAPFDAWTTQIQPTQLDVPLKGTDARLEVPGQKSRVNRQATN